MKVIILTLTIISFGCSTITVTTMNTSPKECTKHYTAPIVDTLLAPIPAAFFVHAITFVSYGMSISSSRSGGSKSMIPFTLISVAGSLAAATSAVYGYSEVSKCRSWQNPYNHYNHYQRRKKDDYDEDYDEDED